MNWICTLCDVFVCKNLLLITVLCAFGDDASVWIIILWTIAYRLETVLATYGRCRRERIKKNHISQEEKKTSYVHAYSFATHTRYTYTVCYAVCTCDILYIYIFGSTQPYRQKRIFIVYFSNIFTANTTSFIRFSFRFCGQNAKFT